MPPDSFSPLPYLTADLPGVGGVIKHEPEDFVVEEQPLYEPCGEGEHLYLWVEKRDISAEILVQHLARSLRIGRELVGVAGLKDRRAVTRQFVSVPAACEVRINDVESDAIRVLKVARHGNKLKTGHLRGNSFDVLIRDMTTDPIKYAEPIADIIRSQGFPNYYGEQRFGFDRETLSLGIDLLTGKKSERDIPRNRRKFLVRLSLSAVQSAIFNEVLRRRIEDRLLTRVLPGDVMQVKATGGPFVAEDLSREQARFEQGEIVISGPMYGRKMRHPTSEVADREHAVLALFGLSPANFAGWKKLLLGTRRPLMMSAEDMRLTEAQQGLRLRFGLDRGTYATSLLREFMKLESEPGSGPVGTGQPE
ncbi:MAG: tRNA pseudouridine(13) synthase TruD [Planctomycetaceae bacterium]|nr:tRNA pseudouridine(13) synthase TruD [Planctomycetaceae bacterium]